MGTISYLLLGRMYNLGMDIAKQIPISTFTKVFDDRNKAVPPQGDENPFSNTIKVIADIALDHWDIILLCLIFRSKKIDFFYKSTSNQAINKGLDWISSATHAAPLVFAVTTPAFKQEIADMYGVTRKTLDKWVKYGCEEVHYEAYKRTRKLSGELRQLIDKTLGDPKLSGELRQLIDKTLKDSVEQKAWNKGEVLEKAESTSYRILKEDVIKLCQKHGYSFDVYKNLDILPPKYVQFLLIELGVIKKIKNKCF